MADTKMVYVYPLNKIQKIFPNLDPSITMDSEMCGIEKGWHPIMGSYCGYVYEVPSSDSSCYRIHYFWFDKRIAKEILPSELRKNGYELVKQRFKLEYDDDEEGIRYMIVRKTSKTLKQTNNILTRIIKQKAGGCHIQDRKRL